MNVRLILVVGFMLGVTACAEKEQVMSEPVAEAPKTAPEAFAPPEGSAGLRDKSFLEHMHLHAERLDEINFALAAGNLEAAISPAHWLSTHVTNSNVEAEWLPFLYGMRSAAEAVESAPDVATARIAAKQINAYCQGCHAAAGISAQ